MRLKNTTALLLVMSWLYSCTKSGSNGFPPDLPTQQAGTVMRSLVFEEEFQTGQLDTAKWFFRLPGLRRDGINDTSVLSFLPEGLMQIKVYSDTPAGRKPRHFSGMIATRQEFLHGRFDCRMKVNNISGSWSAFWLQSPTFGNPIGDPASAGAEIDVVEVLPFNCKSYHTVHWDGYAEHRRSIQFKTAECTIRPDEFNTYSLEWTPSDYRFYVNGWLVWTTNRGLSKRPEFVVLSSEVWNQPSWCGAIPDNGFGSKTYGNNTLQVDYVRIYQ